MNKTLTQIVEKLEKRGESKDEIIEYLMHIINGLSDINFKPNHVDSYLEITLNNLVD